MERPKFIASCSFGKDSLATILLAKEHGEPLDEAVYCEVMFDKDISGEVPEHRDFIYSTAIPTLERMGVKIIVLRSEKTYVELFTGRVTRGPKKGMVRAFPLCGKCAVQRDCKVRPIDRYQKTLPAGTIQYIGVAQDEQDRLLRLESGRHGSSARKRGCFRLSMPSPTGAAAGSAPTPNCPSCTTSMTTTRTCGPGCWNCRLSPVRQQKNLTALRNFLTSMSCSGRRTHRRMISGMRHRRK